MLKQTPRILAALLGLHLVALHVSIAAMEIVSWLTFAAVVLHKILWRERPRFAVLWPCLGLTAVVGASLGVNPALRPFWFQFGFMRWAILLWAFSEAFRATWAPAFERRFVALWSALVGITAVYAAFQFVTGVDLFRSTSHVDFEGYFYRATGFFSGSLTFAYVFGTSCFAIAFPARRWFGRRALALVALSAAVGLVTSYSRGSWIGAILSALAFVLLAGRRLIPYFAGLLAVALPTLALVSPKFNDLLHFRLEHSASVRTHLWRAYAEMFSDRPWLGSGLFQTDLLLPDYYRRLGIDETFASHAHNVPLQWAAGAGVFSLLIYLGLSGYFLRLAWRLRAKTAWGWSLVLSQIFWHVGSLTEANFFDGEVNHLIVYTWALLLALA